MREEVTLGREDRLEGGVHRRRRKPDLLAPGPSQRLRELARGGDGREEQRVEVAEPHEVEGRAHGVGEGALRVPAVMVVEHVGRSPERGQRGHRDDDDATGGEEPLREGERGRFVLEVFEHVGEEHERAGPRRHIGERRRTRGKVGQAHTRATQAVRRVDGEQQRWNYRVDAYHC